jgi:hypothetical protein
MMMDEKCFIAAQHYRAGRFHDAAVTLQECEESRRLTLINNNGSNNIIYSPKVNNDVSNAEDYNITATDNSKEVNGIKTKRMGTELVALLPLARRADIALCHFRSATTTVNVNDVDNCISLHKKALRSNADYRQALVGAASSLVRSATVRQQQQQYQQWIQQRESVADRYRQQRMNSDENKYLRRTMTDTALAMVMAGIAASYLYLHHQESNIDNLEKEEVVCYSNKGVESRSWDVLVDTATMAANLILTKRALFTTTDSSGDDITNDTTSLGTMVGGGGRVVNLEQALIVLNEETAHCVDTNEDSERWNVAMHTFRTTIKVVGCAIGRLILPTMISSSQSNENGSILPFCNVNSRKRQRMEITANNGIDAWNVIYIHSNLSLNARERLVDALSYHLAIIHHPQKRPSLIELREICFNDAIAWEDEADEWLSEDNVNGVTTTSACGGTGYIWKLRTCLHGLELESSNLHPHQDEEHKRCTITALEKLASSSTSQFAYELLGCVRARNGDPSCALVAFQSSLDHGRRDMSRIFCRSNDEVLDGMSDFRTVTNMSICFASMGESVVPLEILLHQWSTFLSSSSQSRDSALIATPQPVIVRLSGNMDSTSSSPAQRHRYSKQRLLWQLFQASSLAQDWNTCLNGIEELLDEGVHDCDQLDARCRLDIARVFALLQRRQTTRAECDTRTLLVKLVPRKSISRALLLSFAELYRADALLCCSKGDLADDKHPWKCTEHVIKVLDSMPVQSNALLTELHVTMLNDFGLALLLKGDSVGALHCFQKAVSCLTFSGSSNGSMNNSPSWLVLPTYFNISLLLLRDGRLDESAKSWLHVRGHFDTWQMALSGDNDALQSLKSLCITTINRHGLLIAKRGTAMLLDQEIVTNWFPPLTGTGLVMEDTTHVGGVDASQITAMDVLLSKYALSTAEKKSSMSFRRSSGGIRY